MSSAPNIDERDVKPANVAPSEAAEREPVFLTAQEIDHVRALGVISEAETGAMALRMAHVNACRALRQVLAALDEGRPIDGPYACGVVAELERRGRESFGGLFAALAELDAIIQDDAAIGRDGDDA